MSFGPFIRIKAWIDRKLRHLDVPRGSVGVEPASPALVARVKQHGRTLVFAEVGTEEARYLDVMGAEANVGGPDLTHIVLRPAPSKVALLEEFLHGTQWRLGIVQRLGVARAEFHVKAFMIRHRRLLGLGEADVHILRQLEREAREGLD